MARRKIKNIVEEFEFYRCFSGISQFINFHANFLPTHQEFRLKLPKFTVFRRFFYLSIRIIP